MPTDRHLPLMLALLAGVLCLGTTLGIPVLDEESYLDIGAQLDLWRPYDWWRPWPPWGDDVGGDAYVFAHPPLFLAWAAAALGLVGSGPVWLLKVAAGLPLAVLLGFAAGLLLRRTGAGWWGGALWLAAPVTVLGLQRGLMPDLMVTALATGAVALWREAWARPERALGLQVVGGVLLALACATKYPALVLVPVLAVDAWRRGAGKTTWVFWLAAAVPWLAVEGWLWASYGRPHLVEVLLRAGELPRGDAGGRGLGVLARLALGVVAVPAVVRGGRLALGVAAVLVGVSLLGLPPGLGGAAGLLVAMAAVGALSLAVVGLSAARGALQGGDPDAWLLGGWALAVVLAVLVGHNFAAPRYLLPAMLPLAALVARLGAGRVGVCAAVVGLQLALSVTLTLSEHQFFQAADHAARTAVSRVPPSDPPAVTGEWAFRHAATQAGAVFAADPTALAAGTVLVAATESSPGPVPAGAVELGRVRVGTGTPGLRVSCRDCGASLYAETMGALPLAWHAGPLETAVIWRLP